MDFTFSDAWVLQSIYFSEKNGDGAVLSDIIAYADYSNHAILSYSEFINALTKLIQVGIVKFHSTKLHTSDNYKQWWADKFEVKKRIYILKTIERTEKYLEKTYTSFVLSAENVQIEITEEDFNLTVSSYLRKTS